MKRGRGPGQENPLQGGISSPEKQGVLVARRCRGIRVEKKRKSSSHREQDLILKALRGDKEGRSPAFLVQTEMVVR